MIIISWNCRGLGNPRSVRELGDLIHSHHPDIIFLCETLIHADKIEEIRRPFNFEACFCVDCMGRGGGLALLWKQATLNSLIQFSNNFIEVEVKVPNNPP